MTIPAVEHAPIIEAREVYKSFGQTPALQGASVAVAAGELLAVMGPSGSGKSTLLQALYRVVLLEAVAPLAAGTPLPVLGHVYYLTMGAGLAASLLVILAALPLLGRITGPATVRFE
jgi:energy-coupling factor transporter ATP-binding protein EcfA2